MKKGQNFHSTSVQDMVIENSRITYIKQYSFDNSIRDEYIESFKRLIINVHTFIMKLKSHKKLYDTNTIL